MITLSFSLSLSLLLSLSLSISRILSVGTFASLSLDSAIYPCLSLSLVRFGPEDRRQIDRTIFLGVFLGDDHPATSREIALRAPDSSGEKNSGRSNALSREGHREKSGRSRGGEGGGLEGKENDNDDDDDDDDDDHDDDHDHDHDHDHDEENDDDSDGVSDEGVREERKVSPNQVDEHRSSVTDLRRGTNQVTD